MARKRVVDVTASSTLSKNQTGSLVVLANAAGLTVTLPTAGRGLEYDFVIKTAITGAAGYYTIDAGTYSIRGAVTSGASNGTAKSQATAAASTVVLGTINGGAVGTRIKLVCDEDGVWNATGSAIGSGDTTVFA